MQKPWKPVLLFACAMIVMIALRNCTGPEPSEADIPGPTLVHEFDVFGTHAVLQLWGDRTVCQHAADAVEHRMLELHDQINLFDEDSELIQLNQTAFDHPFVCSDRLWDLLKTARQAYDETGGAFDVSVGPLMSLWGFNKNQKTYPAPEQVEKTLQAVGLDKIRFDDARQTVRFTHPDTYLDFGGIAKGYALDLAVPIVLEHGIDTGILDLGGNIFCLENTPGNIDSYTIGIRDPQWTGELLETIELRDQAVATSGNYENFIMLDGKFVHHIVDPRTGYPVPNTASVTVIADEGWVSDVFSTAIFVRGPEFAEHLIKIRPHTRVILVRTTDGNNKKRETLRFP
jgi:thiamine biosynthesis lipoprotein